MDTEEAAQDSKMEEVQPVVTRGPTEEIARNTVRKTVDKVQGQLASASKPEEKLPRYLPKGSDWFSRLFNCREPEYDDCRKLWKVRSESGKDGKVLRNFLECDAEPKTSYNVGLFDCPTVAELRHKVKKAEGILRGKLTVSNELGDVAAKHGLPENRYATFQVASQFNCLEFVGPSVTPERGITGYVSDRTQGPACSIACGPATFYRNYFAQVPGAEETGQRKDMMLDNLKDFSEKVGNFSGKYFKVQGGYSMAESTGLQGLQRHLQKKQKEPGGTDDLISCIRVGVHEDVQVTSTNWGSNLVKSTEQLVTQTFCSGCAIAYNRSSNDTEWQEFAQLVLDAAYEATFLAAILAAARHNGEAGSKIVFLTFIGGGVFGNRSEWIHASMRRCCEKYKDYDLDVRIVTYSGSPDRAVQQLAKDYEKKKR